MRAMPNMTVVVPGDDIEAAAAIRAAAAYMGPVYLRLTRDPGPRVVPNGYRFEFGRTYVLRHGADVGLIATGTQSARAMQAASILAADGIDAGVLHVPTIKPLDEAAVVAFARTVRRVVATEEATVIGGLGGAVAEVLGRYRPMPVLRHGIEDMFGESAPNDALLDRYRISAPWLAEAVRNFVKEDA
jgi:transketolase